MERHSWYELGLQLALMVESATSVSMMNSCLSALLVCFVNDERGARLFRALKVSNANYSRHVVLILILSAQVMMMTFHRLLVWQEGMHGNLEEVPL